MSPVKDQAIYEAVVAFDSNMPKMAECSGDCFDSETIPCSHRFDLHTKVFYYTSSAFPGYTDTQITLLFIRNILSQIKKGRVAPRPLCILVTTDQKFLEDAQVGWSKTQQQENSDVKLKFNFTFKEVVVEVGDTLFRITICCAFRNAKSGYFKQRKKRWDLIRNAVDNTNRLFKKLAKSQRRLKRP